MTSQNFLLEGCSINFRGPQPPFPATFSQILSPPPLIPPPALLHPPPKERARGKKKKKKKKKNEEAMGSEAQELVFLLIPLMSQSHLLPFTDMAKRLAGHGVSVTVVMTPLNALRYKSVLDQAQKSGLDIDFLTLPFPCKEAGLPEGCENVDSLPSSDLVTAFFEASNMLQVPLEKRLEAMEHKPSCIITDICFPWTTDVALKFGLPRIVFHTISCFTLLCSHSITRSKVMERINNDDEPFVIPGLPDKVEFTKAQLPQMMKDGPDDLEDLLDQFKAAELSADGVLVNSFEELEKNYMKAYRKVVKKLWCIGPLSLSPVVDSAKLERGNMSSIDNQCLDWLDSKDPKSVLYVCFGSLCHVSASQLVELALGLEASHCCFMWVIRKGDSAQELEKWLLEYGFEERTTGRGLIIRGWAPQVMILSHPSVGGFMTHCGWNSTLEAVSAGVPMITWPMFAEQFYNEKQITQVLRIGVTIGVRRPVEWAQEEDKAGVMVSKEAVQHAIGRLMDEGEEGAERRRRVKDLGKAARRAVEEGGSSYFNMCLMIHYVQRTLSSIVRDQ